MGSLRPVLPAMLWHYHRPRRPAVVHGARIPQMQEVEETGAVASASAEKQMGAVAAFVTHVMAPRTHTTITSRPRRRRPRPRRPRPCPRRPRHSFTYQP